MKSIGLIGLGKMGSNLIQNMKNNGFDPIGFDLNPDARKKVSDLGIKVVDSVESLIQSLPTPRYVMLLVPAGKPTTDQINQLVKLLQPHDVIIDAGNSYYQDTLNHAKLATSYKIDFVDVGTSGGVDGALNGACFMVGGSDHVIAKLNDLFTKLAVKDGYLHTGAIGSGHFAKMVHNGIEYGMMQAIAEGFELIEKSNFNYDQTKLAHVWNHGSVIRSWLIELAENALQKDNHLENITGFIGMNGEGTWTVMEGLNLGVPVPVISLAVQMRQRSQQSDTYSGKVVASLRNEFGGHETKPITHLDLLDNQN